MPVTDPKTDIDAQFSDPNAAATPWAHGRQRLEQAEIFWLTTVRPDGRPHVTPLIAVWLDDALYFGTGAEERKAKNLEHNRHCILTTGTNAIGGGLDLVVEGEAARIRDESKLQRIAAAYESKYGSSWHFTVRNGNLHHHGNDVLIFEVAPAKAFGFGKGESTFSQTRWRFRA